MKNKHIYGLLALIIIVSLALNSFMLFARPLHEEGYFSLRYSEYLQENFTPMFNDELSYGGKQVEEPFLAYYLFAAASFIHDNLARILSALLIASLIAITFFISSMFIQKKYALLPALFAGFIPVMFKINILSPNALAFPILFLLLYSFTKLEDKRFLYLFVILSIILPFTSFLSIFFAFSILVYLLITAIEKKRLTNLEREALLFSLFVNVLVTIFTFRQSLLDYGPSFIWQNIPSSVLAEFFKEFALIDTLGSMGIAVLFLGAIGFVFSFKEKKSLLLSAFLITSLVFLWLRLVPLNLGLILFSLTLASLSALCLKVMLPYLKQTKFSQYKKHIIAALFIIAILTSALPAGIAAINFESKVSPNSARALEYLEGKNSTVLAPYEYGHAISFFGNKNVADSFFLLAPEPERRLKDINLVYTSQSETLVLDIMHKYGVKYFILDNFIREKLEIESLVYVKNKDCFRNAYDEDETKIYKVKC